MKCSPFLGRLKSDGHVTVPLDSVQMSALSEFKNDIKSGKVCFEPNSCICGTANDIVIACRDRYGLDTRTVLCYTCGLMRVDPYMSEKSLRMFYKNYYRRIYSSSHVCNRDHFDAARDRGSAIIQFIEKAGIELQGMVMEIGCGSGGLLDAFQQRGCKVAGCDYGKSFSEYGRQRNLPIEDGDWSTLTRHAPADMIILSHVLEHLRHPITELHGISSLLKQDGYIYVQVPGLFWLEHSYNTDIARYLQNAHAYHYCLESLDYVMSLTGFKRVAGDEVVNAIYRREAVQALCPDALARKTLGYLTRIERIRRYRTMRSYISPVVTFIRKNSRLIGRR